MVHPKANHRTGERQIGLRAEIPEIPGIARRADRPRANHRIGVRPWGVRPEVIQPGRPAEIRRDHLTVDETIALIALRRPTGLRAHRAEIVRIAPPGHRGINHRRVSRHREVRPDGRSGKGRSEGLRLLDFLAKSRLAFQEKGLRILTLTAEFE